MREQEGMGEVEEGEEKAERRRLGGRKAMGGGGAVGVVGEWGSREGRERQS